MVSKILKMESGDEAEVLTPIQARDDNEDDNLSFGSLYKATSKDVSNYKMTRIFN